MKSALPLMLLAAVISGAAAPSVPPPQWPPAPQAARLRFVAEIAGPRAAGAGRLGGLLRAILGLDQKSEVSADRLARPTGVFVSSGTVFVADPGRHAVLRYEEATGKGEWWPRSFEPKLASPVGVAAAPDGRLLVLDSMLRKVFILDREGKAAGELEGDPQGMGHPAALAVSGRRVYVSDVKNHRVSVYGLDGNFISAFGRRGSGPGEFNFPTYLWFDRASDRLWVCDSGNFRLQRFDADGVPQGALGENGNRPGYLARPRGLATDSEGHVYVSDGAFEAFQIFDDKARLLLFVGRSGSEPGRFSMPAGLFIDGRDRLYVADTQNARIQVFQYIREVQP